MLRDQPQSDAQPVVLPGQVPRLRIRERPQPRSRLLQRYAVALGDDVDAPDVEEDLHRLVAGRRRAQRALIAELPAPHDHDPRRRERSDHPEGSAPTPSQGTTGNEEPGGDGQREEERDRSRERRRREQRPHQKSLPGSRPLPGDEAHPDGDAGDDEDGKRRLRQEQARGRHRRQIEGEKQARHQRRPMPPEPPGDPRGEAHGQHAESDPDEDHGARVLSGRSVDAGDQKREAGHAAPLRRGRRRSRRSARDRAACARAGRIRTSPASSCSPDLPRRRPGRRRGVRPGRDRPPRRGSSATRDATASFPRRVEPGLLRSGADYRHEGSSGI